MTDSLGVPGGEEKKELPDVWFVGNIWPEHNWFIIPPEQRHLWDGFSSARIVELVPRSCLEEAERQLSMERKECIRRGIDIADLSRQLTNVERERDEALSAASRAVGAEKEKARLSAIMGVLLERHNQGSPLCGKGYASETVMVPREWLARLHEVAGTEQARSAAPEEPR